MGGHGSKGHGHEKKKRDKVGAKFLRREEERMKMEKTNRRESIASVVEISATHSFGKSDSSDSVHSDGYDAITALHDFRASIVSEKRYQLLMDRAVQRYCSLQSEVIGRIPKGTRVDIAQTRVEANLTRGQIVNLEQELAHLNGCWISMWGTGPNGGSDENAHAKWVVPIGAAADTNSTMTGGDDFVTVEDQNDMLAEIMAHAVSFEVDSDNRSDNHSHENDLAHRIFDDIRKEPSKDASLDPEQQETIAALEEYIKLHQSPEKLLVTQTDSKASLEESVDRTPQKKHTRVVSFTDSVTMKNKAHAESLTSESSAPNDKQIELLGEISQLRQEIRELQNIHNIQVKRQAEEAARKRDAMSNPDNPDYAAVLKAIHELKEAQKSVRNVPPANGRKAQIEADVPGEKQVELIQEIEDLRAEIKELQTTRAEEASRKSDRSDTGNYGAVLMAIRGLQETMIRLQKREPETVKIVVESPKSKRATPSPQSDESVDTQPTRMKRDAGKRMKPRRKRRRHRGVAYSPRVREIPMQKYPPQAGDTDVYIHPFPGGPPIKLEGIIPPMSPYMPMTSHAPVHAAPHPHAHHPRHHPPSRRTTKIGSRSHPQSRRTSTGPSTYYEDAHDDPYAHDSRYYQSNRYKYVVSKLEE